MSDSHKRLLAVITDTAADYSSMPFFVRPMVKAGLRKRTGRSLDQWTAVARELAGAATSDDRNRVVKRHAGLVADLGRLAEHYRTAPERAGRAMKGAALARVTEQAQQRERIVRELIDDLG